MRVTTTPAMKVDGGAGWPFLAGRLTGRRVGEMSGPDAKATEPSAAARSTPRRSIGSDALVLTDLSTFPNR